jgi:hypothetical protein
VALSHVRRDLHFCFLAGARRDAEGALRVLDAARALALERVDLGGVLEERMVVLAVARVCAGSNGDLRQNK